MAHGPPQQIPYQQIHALVHRLSPRTLIMDHDEAYRWVG